MSRIPKSNGAHLSETFSVDGYPCNFDLLIYSLEKEFDNRPSPEQILAHPWAMGMERLNVDMERWIKEAWGWKT